MPRSHRVSRPRLRPLARLHRELETFRTVADFTYDWEIWLDPAGAARYVSPSCRRITGYEPREVLSDPRFFHRIIHPDDLPGWLAAMRKSRDEAAPSLDFRITRKDGSRAWLAQETTRVLSPAGVHQGLRLSLRDVTERVEAQRALREARELLEERVLARTRDLELSRERYRALSAHLQERIEGERTRISREIHDELGQNLTALNMGLYRLEKGAAGCDPEAVRHLAGLKELVAATLESVRRISRELRPPIL
ncbi:MAG: histidine kinase, partial [Acidobacteriota bacterium]